MEISKSHKSRVDLALFIVSSLGSRLKKVMETMLIIPYKLKSVSCPSTAIIWRTAQNKSGKFFPNI